jgi:hypothetical protein
VIEAPFKRTTVDASLGMVSSFFLLLQDTKRNETIENAKMILK